MEKNFLFFYYLWFWGPAMLTQIIIQYYMGLMCLRESKTQNKTKIARKPKDRDSI